jgi:predicted small lipoprotein YifL
MGRFAVWAVWIAAAAVLAGCGQKGPLYLPDKGGQVVTRPGGQAQQPAPQSQPAQTATQSSDADSTDGTDNNQKDDGRSAGPGPTSTK